MTILDHAIAFLDWMFRAPAPGPGQLAAALALWSVACAIASLAIVGAQNWRNSRVPRKTA